MTLQQIYDLIKQLIDKLSDGYVDHSTMHDTTQSMIRDLMDKLRCCCFADDGLPRVVEILNDKWISGIRYPIVLKLDKPAPADCVIQLNRLSRKKHSAWTFKEIYIADIHYPKITVSEGAAEVGLTKTVLAQMYRPPYKRGPKYKRYADYARGRQRHNPINKIRDSKAAYKFRVGVYRPGVSFTGGELSAQALQLKKWVENHQGALRTLTQHKTI